jgi:hypothetical protein
VPVLTNRPNLVRILALLPGVWQVRSVTRATFGLGTYGVPEVLRTCSCVSSSDMYPSVRPAKRPDRRTRTGMTTPPTTFCEAVGPLDSARLTYSCRPFGTCWLAAESAATRRGPKRVAERVGVKPIDVQAGGSSESWCGNKLLYHEKAVTKRLERLGIIVRH